jgi:H2-forming N5,N10-methylenetetrahydromethanopterin dehydrogenase-like enzyme
LCGGSRGEVHRALDVIAKIDRYDLGIARVGETAGDAGLEGQNGNKTDGKRADQDGHDRHHDDQFNECEPLLDSTRALIRTGTVSS